ncbi:GNAT family N-acetyltransferase [Flavobacterium sp. '19STA2R22 D10 B1']|uniref:GNAT family N-acetyltransferase n=1 Tax=Flavobacterium aerium TaxID=3037261 RepID=UPI00278C5A38|nr:GNAT family N-acetyltransferase [Flavobacterium sp. '19STA2R22 D10 B1']
MNYKFEKAESGQINEIWEIFIHAIERRKQDGSEQWQDGYPNPTVLKRDIENGYGYVISNEEDIIGYCALMINDEPEYANLKGQWLTDGDFVVFHRVAVSEKYLKQGFSKIMLQYIDAFAMENQISSVKADTNFDNAAMLALFEKTGYQYCGKVTFRGCPRKAFEKVLKQHDI